MMDVCLSARLRQKQEKQQWAHLCSTLQPFFSPRRRRGCLSFQRWLHLHCELGGWSVTDSSDFTIAVSQLCQGRRLVWAWWPGVAAWWSRPMQMASQMVDIYTTGLQKSPVWKLFFRTEHTRLLYSRRNAIPMPFAAWTGQCVVWVTMAMTWQTFLHIAWECRFFFFNFAVSMPLSWKYLWIMYL